MSSMLPSWDGWGAERGTVYREAKKLGSNLCHRKPPGGSGNTRQVPIPALAPGHIFVSASFLASLKIWLHLE